MATRIDSTNSLPPWTVELFYPFSELVATVSVVQTVGKRRKERDSRDTHRVTCGHCKTPGIAYSGNGFLPAHGCVRRGT